MMRPPADRRRLLVSLAATSLIIASGAACTVEQSDDVEGSESEVNGQRYDTAYGDRIARTALRMDGRASRNLCLAEMQNSLERAGVKPFPRLPGAVDLDNWAMKQGDRGLANWGFQKQNRSVGDIPRGSIIGWRPGQCGYHSVYGHIEIAVGGGRACSDFCGTIKTNCGAPNVYVPVGFRKTCGNGRTEGPIDAKYQSLGGCDSFLGAPITDELRTPDGFGRHNVFERGSIYWTEATGAFEVHGAIRDKYKELGWETGVLKYPVTDEGPSADGKGRYNHFQGGSIYWSEATGAHEVRGAVREKWQSLGWETGFLGYPLTDEMKTGDGAYSDFVRGSVYWTEKTGAHEVHGRIRDKWKELGAEKSAYGYPTSDEYAAGGSRKSDFQSGSITYDQKSEKFTLEPKGDPKAESPKP